MRLARRRQTGLRLYMNWVEVRWCHEYDLTDMHMYRISSAAFWRSSVLVLRPRRFLLTE
jgi:hypothetical protein